MLSPAEVYNNGRVCLCLVSDMSNVILYVVVCENYLFFRLFVDVCVDFTIAALRARAHYPARSRVSSAHAQ